VFPGQSVLLVPGERKYLGQFTYRSMGYGSYGEFSIALEGVSNPPTDLDDSRMRDEAGSLIPFEPIEGIVIVYHADFFPCFWDSECYWVDSDPCTNDRCVDGDCVAVPIPDCEFISIVSADPPDGAIDARQPSEFDGGDVVGWSSFDLTFDRDPAELNRFDFEVTQEGGQGEPPTVTSVMPLGGNVLRVNLSAGIAPAAWTTITHLDSGTSVCVGYLPGDVNGDGTSGPLDVLRLIDCLNSAAVCEIRQCDVDRSGKCDARDALREVDLLNGANAYGAWNGQSLPMHFCP